MISPSEIIETMKKSEVVITIVNAKLSQIPARKVRCTLKKELIRESDWGGIDNVPANFEQFPVIAVYDLDMERWMRVKMNSIIDIKELNY